MKKVFKNKMIKYIIISDIVSIMMFVLLSIIIKIIPDQSSYGLAAIFTGEFAVSFILVLLMGVLFEYVKYSIILLVVVCIIDIYKWIKDTKKR